MELRPYQERAVEEALASPFKYEAFDMGLGKTRIMLEYLKRSGRKALVLAPLLVATRTWPQEIEKWTDLSYTVLHGSGKDVQYEQDSQVKLLNYDGIRWFFKRVTTQGSGDLRERVLILDEATALKSPRSQRFKQLAPLRQFFKGNGIFCLSGGPMPNGYQDLWSQYYMLDGGEALYRNYQDFEDAYFIRDRYNKFLMRMRPGAAGDIQKRVAPLTSVLRAQDYLTMPSSVFVEMTVPLPADAKRLYQQFRRDYVARYGTDVVEADSAGTQTNYLRQITQGGFYTDSGFTAVHTAKVEALLQLLDEARSPILCPIYFSFEYQQISEALGYKPPLIAGGVSGAVKQQILDRWDRGDVPLLVVQPASISHGLNMQTGGHIIVWYGRPWSLEQYQQLNGRLIRPGQKHPVRVVFISASGTIDARVASVLANKYATQEEFKQAILDGFLDR